MFNDPMLVPEIVGGMLVAISALVFFSRIPIRYNLRNLVVRWVTTLMTAAAFTLVVALMVVMLAFVNGMNRLSETSGQPSNILIMGAGVTDEAFSNLAFSGVDDIENQNGVAEVDGRRLCSKETYIVVNQARRRVSPNGPKRRFLQVRGIDDPLVAARVHDVELLAGGEWFSAAGVQAADPKDSNSESLIQVVLGEGVAKELAKDRTDEEASRAKNRERLEVGDEFELGNRQWVVSGVMKQSGSTFDSEVWAYRPIVGPLFGKDAYSSVVVRATDPRAAEKLENFYNNEYSKASLQALVETKYYSSLSQTNRQFAFSIGILAAVMGAGGVFGVMNTMFAVIAQRVKDIGVLRILGFARWQVFLSFMIESMLLALVGGILGCALGMVVDGWSATSTLSSGNGAGKSVVLRLAVDANAISSGVLMALAMGFFGGAIPSLSAMYKRPLEALR